MNHVYDCGNIDLLDSLLHIATLLSIESTFQSFQYLRPTLCCWPQNYLREPIAAVSLATISYAVGAWVS